MATAVQVGNDQPDYSQAIGDVASAMQQAEKREVEPAAPVHTPSPSLRPRRFVKLDSAPSTIDSVFGWHQEEVCCPPIVMWGDTTWWLIRAAAGVFSGFGSALTGTSGPVVSMPLFLLLKWPVHEGLGCAQAIQVPLALLSKLLTRA